MQSPQQTIKSYIKKCNYLRMLSFFICYIIDKYFDNRYLYYKNIFKDVPFNKDEYDVAISYQGPTDTIDYYITHKVKAAKFISSFFILFIKSLDTILKNTSDLYLELGIISFNFLLASFDITYILLNLVYNLSYNLLLI